MTNSISSSLSPNDLATLVRPDTRHIIREELIFILVKFWNLLQATPELVSPRTLSEVYEKSCNIMPPSGTETVAWTPPDHYASPQLHDSESNVVTLT